MAFDPVALTRAYHAALDAHEVDEVEKFFAADACYKSAGIGEVVGRDAILRAMREYFKKSPDHQAWDDKLSQVSDRVARAEWQLRATNKLTGEVTKRRGIETVTFNAEGLIVRVEVEDR